MDIKTLRSNLLKEAKNSPSLLSDLAGLETYISESYSERTFIELLQNADDANSKRFFVTSVRDFLIVANDGREFTEFDIESLCRSASSHKVRGENIGYRGVGFKSVVSIANEVHLISGNYEISFSRELTRELIPSAIRVPLVRIPHKIRDEILNDLADIISIIKSKNYTTIFIFSGVDIQQVQNEYISFSKNSILFLQNILNVDIVFDKEIHINISRECINSQQDIVTVNLDNHITKWLLVKGEKCCLAWILDKEMKISRLEIEQSLLHAFLPTEDKTGFPFIVNGDFSTDPSRRHLIFDEYTNSIINNVAKTYLSFVEKLIFTKESSICDDIISVSAYLDVKIAGFSSNKFFKKLITNIKELSRDKFLNFKITPQWFNRYDYFNIYSSSHNCYVNLNLLRNEMSTSFFSLFDCKKETFNNILRMIGTYNISLLGCAQILSYGLKLVSLNQCDDNLKNIKIVQVNNNLVTLEELNKSNCKIDDSFLALILEQGISINEICASLKKMRFNNIVDKLKEPSSEEFFVENRIIDNNSKKQDLLENKSFSTGIKKWRSVEENTLEILNSQGFSLVDVSNQNLGYDLEGSSPNGEKIYIEVKSIDYVGQKFKMTNNEYAVAQYKKDSYCLAITMQNYDSIKIELIFDPVSKLIIERQCVQWVWECEKYNYNPEVYKLS